MQQESNGDTGTEIMSKYDEYMEISQEIQGDEYAINFAKESGLIENKNEKAFYKIKSALDEISEKHVDTGYGLDGMDAWITIEGIEYFITVKAKNLKN